MFKKCFFMISGRPWPTISAGWSWYGYWPWSKFNFRVYLEVLNVWPIIFHDFYNCVAFPYNLVFDIYFIYFAYILSCFDYSHYYSDVFFKAIQFWSLLWDMKYWALLITLIIQYYYLMVFGIFVNICSFFNDFG